MKNIIFFLSLFFIINLSAQEPLVYTALIAQTGTGAPIPTVLENTLGETPLYLRTQDGAYKMTCAICDDYFKIYGTGNFLMYPIDGVSTTWYKLTWNDEDGSGFFLHTYTIDAATGSLTYIDDAGDYLIRILIYP